jgi:hypothetical protein
MNSKRPIEVLNAGTMAAMTRQELIYYLTTVSNYGPSLVVIFDGVNDSGYPLHMERRINHPYNYGAKEVAWNRYIASHKTPLYKLILSRSKIARRCFPSLDQGPQKGPICTPEEVMNSVELRKEYARAYTDNWERILRVVRAFDAEPVFILQPTRFYGDFPEGKLGSSQDKRSFAHLQIYDAFREEVRRFRESHRDVDVHDLSQLLPDPKCYVDFCHVYDEFNKPIANEIARLLSGKLAALDVPK